MKKLLLLIATFTCGLVLSTTAYAKKINSYYPVYKMLGSTSYSSKEEDNMTFDQREDIIQQYPDKTIEYYVIFGQGKYNHTALIYENLSAVPRTKAQFAKDFKNAPKAFEQDMDTTPVKDLIDTNVTAIAPWHRTKNGDLFLGKFTMDQQGTASNNNLPDDPYYIDKTYLDNDGYDLLCKEEFFGKKTFYTCRDYNTNAVDIDGNTLKMDMFVQLTPKSKKTLKD
ncbi:hypothetical protein ACT5E2_09710 (plasmid) [Limosilactobacillus mucosae]|uniref:hypothetical protein n=1 Tax=Limosilactobacillus mucosae TaxID=97478 RepID=UPI00403932CE